MPLHNFSEPTASVDELAEALARSNERYASLVERAGYGIYSSTPDGRLLEVNSVMVRMLGYSNAEELLSLELGRDVYVDPAERVRLRDRPGSTFPDWVETQWKRRDGNTIAVRLCVRGILDASGNVEAYDGIVEDVTERQRR
ncbi:MAG TPA: PAS domain-containing protein, partial [Gemmatimonadaceae bacterium]